MAAPTEFSTEERARLLALDRFQILGTPREQAFDDLARIAAHVCGTPIALVNLIAFERQWSKAHVGWDAPELPREAAFCSHTVAQRALFEVPDAAADPRFSASPLVQGPPGVRFYAGAPLLTPEGHALGTVCVIDRVPRSLSDEQREVLRALARQAVNLMQLRRGLVELRESNSERTGVQRALKETEERYRDLFEGASDLIQAVSPDGRFLYTNRAWRDTLGYAPAEISELRLFDVIHPQHRGEAADLMQWVMEGGDVDTAQLVLVSKDGRRIVAEGSLSCKKVDGRPVATRAILRDVTERRRTEERLRASEARTRSIIDHMTGGLITLDGSGTIESINPAGERIFGYRREELVGRHLALLLPEPSGQDKASYLKAAFPKALGRVTEWQGRRKNGEVFPFELSMFEFETDKGRHFAGNIRDVSERQEVERLKKEFVSTVSHELRTPLTSIRGSLSLLASGMLGELPGEAQEAVEIADRNALRLIGLINDILDLERFESGKLEMHMGDVALADVLQRSVEAVRGVAEKLGVALEIQGGAASAWGDADRLVQVVVNLLGNAVKFSSAGQTVTLEAERKPPFVEVRVIDRGRGIPKALQDAVFERFKQVEASDAREKGGTGLGLAICKTIVERHGGAIGVWSEEGHGSTFFFRIPETASVAAEARAS
jgi:PAS domain S-box-containing protein